MKANIYYPDLLGRMVLSIHHNSNQNNPSNILMPIQINDNGNNFLHFVESLSLYRLMINHSFL